MPQSGSWIGKMMDRQFLGHHILNHSQVLVRWWCYYSCWLWSNCWLVETFIQVPSIAGQAAINVSHDGIYSLLVIPFLLIISPLIHINPFPWHYFDHLIRGMGWPSHCIPIRSQLQLKSIIFDGEYILIIFNDYPCLNCTKTSYETTIKPPFLALGHGQKTIHRVYRTSSGLWHAPWRHASCSHGLWLPVRLAAASGV